MNVEEARGLISDAQLLLTQALTCLDDEPPPPQYVTVTTPAELDAALVDGARIKLVSTLVYPNRLTIAKNDVVLEAAELVTGRMTKTAPAPSFPKGITVNGTDIDLVGLECQNSAGTDIVIIAGANCTVDRCRVLGNPTTGVKRGIAANSAGNCQILRCYVDDCFGPYPGNDTQAIIAWDMLPGLLIEDCYLSGGSETIMIGGADPSSAARDPKDITIRGNTITKNPAWQAQMVGVKNTLELKNARNVLIENNAIEYSWAGHGQDGYALALTVRNQSGTDPTATVQDVMIRNNTISHAAGAVTILAEDNNHLPPDCVKMARVTITGNTFTDINSATYSAGITKKLIPIDRAPEDLTITNNTFDSTGQTSTIYFDHGPLTRFTWTGNTYKKSQYGMFGANVSPVNTAFVTYAPGGVTAPNTEIP